MSRFIGQNYEGLSRKLGNFVNFYFVQPVQIYSLFFIFYSNIGLSGHCVFATFQPIPYMYSQQDSATQFNDVDNPNVALESCSLNKAKAKFPDQAEHMKLQWLNESYVDLTIANKKTLHFKVWKSTVGVVFLFF